MSDHPPSYPPVGDRLFGLRILPYERRAKWWKRGVTRECFLIGRYAIKIPSLYDWKNWLQGFLANMQERDVATMRTPELCPVVFSLAGGWLVVMRRAEPLSDEQWRAFMQAVVGCDQGEAAFRGYHARDPVRPWIDPSNDYIVPVELKRDSFGMLDGRVVAVDYGN